MLSYILSWFFENTVDDVDLPKKKNIDANMLLAQRSKLKSLSSKTILSKPPSLLEQIQNVKLKSPKPLSPKIYSAQHPVLRELVETVRRKRETTITELYI